ncbi:MAG: hypothetical protein Rubg2KO_03280 [Rubricoccaceae bacterium]
MDPQAPAPVHCDTLASSSMRFLILFAALLAGCSSTASSVSAQQQAVEARLADLLAAASAPEATASSIAPFLIARGSDPSRDWKVPADISIEREHAYVESALANLKQLLADVRQPDGGLAYEVIEFVVEAESEGEWHVLMVEFETGDAQEAMFAFLPLGETYYLGDIDR